MITGHALPPREERAELAPEPSLLAAPNAASMPQGLPPTVSLKPHHSPSPQGTVAPRSQTQKPRSLARCWPSKKDSGMERRSLWLQSTST